MTPDNRRILLIGEKAKDVFVYGTAERLSPEAPVVVHKPTHVETNDGMAANVKANILSLAPGTKVDFFHQTQDIFKIRHIDEASGQHLLRVDDGDDAFEPDFWVKMIAGMVTCQEGYKAIVVSDYNKGLISTKMMAALAEIARELEVPMWTDTKAILGEWSKDIDFIKINDKEYRAQIAAGVTEPWKWCRNLIVTRGRDGADIYSSDGTVVYHSDSCAGKVWSVSGCGDTVLAALVIKYLVNGGNIRTSLDYAMRAAAIAVSKPGVVAVRADEVEDWT